MSSRGIVARRTADGFKGVFHERACQPWILGNALLVELHTRRGDLDGVVSMLVDAAPHGWVSFIDRERFEADSGTAAFLGVDILDHQAWVEWLYVFDVEGRRLEVWFSPEKAKRGPPIYTVTFAEDGAANPPLFREPVPEAPKAKVLSGGKGDTDEDRNFRGRVADRLRVIAPRFDAAKARSTFVDGFAAAIDGGDWQPFEEDPLAARFREALRQPARSPLRLWEDERRLWMVPLEADPPRRYWEAEVGAWRLRYPSPDQRADDDVGEGYGVLRFDGAWMALPALLTMFPAPSVDGDETRATDAFFIAVVQALCGTEAQYEAIDDRVFFFKTVVRSVSQPDREIAQTEARAIDPDCKLGDTLGWNLPPYGGLWSVLDWIRLKAVDRPPLG